MQQQEYKRYEQIGNWDFSDIKYTVEQQTNWDFYEKIKKYSNNQSLLLDLGTGGGEKALEKLPQVGMIIATDFSEKMIATAKQNQKKYDQKRIQFAVMDNLKMTFPEQLFDIVCARHTIIDAKQIYSCLKRDGILVIEGVDKKDCWEVKSLFGRGQAFNDAISISQKDYQAIQEAGFSEIDRQEIIQYEYYQTEQDLLALLFKTPILNDFVQLHNTKKSNQNRIEKDKFENM